MAATAFNSSEKKVCLTLGNVHKKAGGTKMKYTEEVIFHMLPQHSC